VKFFFAQKGRAGDMAYKHPLRKENLPIRTWKRTKTLLSQYMFCLRRAVTLYLLELNDATSAGAMAVSGREHQAVLVICRRDGS
jgi:hypothetical protein